MEQTKSHKEILDKEKVIIDLGGPEGNVFSLIGMASVLLKKLGKNPDFVVQNMKEKDYNHALSIFEQNLGHVTKFINDPRK